MEYLPLYLVGFGILVLGLIGFAYFQNEGLKKKLILQTKEMLRNGSNVEAVHQHLINQKLEPPQAAKIIDLALERIYVEDALGLLNQGKTEDEAKTLLVKAGAKPTSADEAVGTAQFHKFCQDRPVVSMLLGIVLPLVGLAVIAAGLFLWYGNKGAFVTFPYSGHFVIVIGVVILALGSRFFIRSLSS